MKKANNILSLVIAGFLLVGCGPKFEEENRGDFILVKNLAGEKLGYHADSGIKIITANRFAFKDLNRNGK